MMTMMTRCGLLPLVVVQGNGAEVQRPLATAVIGGLFPSTLFVVVVLPALCGWFGEPGDWPGFRPPRRNCSQTMCRKRFRKR